jgi:hypothetical protein
MKLLFRMSLLTLVLVVAVLTASAQTAGHQAFRQRNHRETASFRIRTYAQECPFCGAGDLRITMITIAETSPHRGTTSDKRLTVRFSPW